MTPSIIPGAIKNASSTVVCTLVAVNSLSGSFGGREEVAMGRVCSRGVAPLQSYIIMLHFALCASNYTTLSLNLCSDVFPRSRRIVSCHGTTPSYYAAARSRHSTPPFLLQISISNDFFQTGAPLLATAFVEHGHAEFVGQYVQVQQPFYFFMCGRDF